jgi:tail tube protein gp19
MSKHDGKHRRHSFRLSWDGKVVVGVDRVSPLVRLVEVITVRDGSSPGGSGHTVPGRIGTEPVTIERPAGADSAFEDWARSLTDPTGSAGAGPRSTASSCSGTAPAPPPSRSCGSRTTAGNT